MKTEFPPIVAETKVSASAEEAWKAITDQPLMVQWYFDNIPDFKPEVGFVTEFNVRSGDRDFLHQWKVLEVNPGKMIAYTWAYAQYPGDGKVVFEVIPEDDGATIRLTCFGIETFHDNIPEFSRESCQAGWNFFIKERLKAFLG